MRSTRLRTFARVALLGAMLAAPLALTQVPSVRAAVFSLAAFMRTGSPAALALYVVVAALGSVLTIPLWILSALAGYAYGMPLGALAALPSITLGALVAALLGRRFAKTSMGAALREHPRFRTIDAIVRHDGRRIATLLRVTPVMPQNFLHYALGATSLPLRDFAFATFVGLIPAVSGQVYVGSLVRDATELMEQGGSLTDPRTIAKFAGAVVATAVLLTLVVRRAQRALAQALAAQSRETPAAE